MSASSPPRTFSTSARTVASPHSTRCSPQIQRSPGRLIGSAGGSGTSSRSAVSSLVPASSRSISTSSKPSRSRSKASSFSAASSAASISSFQPAVDRDLVVGDHQRAPLHRRQVRQHDHRSLGQSQLARRHDPAVAGDDHAVVADQHRVHETELGDRSGDLRHLLLGMGAGVARVRDQSLERPALDRMGKLRRHGSFDWGSVTAEGGNRSCLYRPVYHLLYHRDYRGHRFKSAVLRGFLRRTAPECRVVTARGGNSNFAADGSEIPGLCPPHTISAREDPSTSRRSDHSRESRDHTKNIHPNSATVSPFDVSPKNVSRCAINLTARARAECPL